MVDHRKTSSQRAYQLPGWFFVLSGVFGVLSLAGAAWVLVANPTGLSLSWPERSTPSVSAPPPTQAAEPEPSTTSEPAASERDGIEVIVLNAAKKAGLAAGVAKTAEEAGWTIGDVDNWIYGAAVNAVYYPEGHQDEGELLAKDLDIASVRPSTSGMSQDELTVLLVNTP